MKSKRVFIDFDGTICPHGLISEEPFPGCVDTINAMMDAGMLVTIFSCRGNINICDPDEVTEMVSYLTKYGIRYTDIFYGKPFYDLLIDDRAFGFTNDWTVIRKRVIGDV